MTSESDLFTGDAELSLRIGASGRAFRSNGRALAQDRYPVLIAKRLDGSILYTLTLFAANVGGQQVNFARVEAFNEGRSRAPGAADRLHPQHRGRVRYVTRTAASTTPTVSVDRPTRTGRACTSSPEADFNPLSVYAFSGHAFLRDGTVLYDAHALEPAARVTRSVRRDAGPVDARRCSARASTRRGQAGPAAACRLPHAGDAGGRRPRRSTARISHASFNAYLRRTVGAWAPAPTRRDARSTCPSRRSVEHLLREPGQHPDAALPGRRTATGSRRSTSSATTPSGCATPRS